MKIISSFGNDSLSLQQYYIENNQIDFLDENIIEQLLLEVR